VRSSRESPYPLARLVVEAVCVGLGLAAFAWAWRADLRYCERNLLFQYWAFDAGERAKAVAWRVAAVVVGCALVFLVRPRAGRFVARHGGVEAAMASLRMGLGLVLAFVASELALRVLHLPHAPDRAHTTEVLIGEEDARYGWRYIGPRKATLDQGRRPIEYAIDADHDRAPAPDFVPDLEAPTLLFTGESITVGHGLTWGETYPALVGSALDLQVVNLGVHGYGTDQAFLRLYDELPRFRRPVAVVTIFLAPMAVRMTNDDHPRLELDGLVPKVVPAHGFFHDLHVAQVERLLLPHPGDGALRMAARIFRETDRLARERGAKAVFVAPRFDSQEPRGDAYLIRELFTDQGLTVVDVDYKFEPLPDDGHPNAAATKRLADAVTLAIRAEVARR
jgi:hypothetical protein